MSRQVGQPRLRSRLRRMARWYTPDWLKRGYRSVCGRRHAVPASDSIGDSPAAATQGRQGRIAAFTDAGSTWLGPLLRATNPGSTVVQVGATDQDQQDDHDHDTGLMLITGGTDSDTHAALTAHRPYDVIIDATAAPVADRLRRFRRTWFQLAEDGRYCLRADTTSEDVWQYVTRLTAYRDQDHQQGVLKREERSVAESIRQAVAERGTVTITCARSAMPKLRESEIERVLQARPEIGSVLIKKSGLIFTRDRSLRCNVEPLGIEFPVECEVPEVQLREYDDVLCCPHQVVISHDIVLPDSFRHFTKPRLRNRYLDDLGPWFARYPHDVSAPKELAGSYFYLSSEVPGHFGHLMTEQLSRMWAWSIAKQRHPDLKALLPPADGQLKPAGFELEVLSAAGVGPADYVSPKGVLRVERLLSATPMLVDPSYVHPELPEVWRRAATNLIMQAPERDWPAKVFISRGANYQRRPCHNVAEVEEFVTRHGYTVLYPEDYSVAEQAMIFDRAEVIAGFAGSGMFSLIFCAEPKEVILILSESYTARNEYLIAFALGHRVTLVWCDPDIAQPDKGWDVQAHRSGFSVDLERDGDFLADALSKRMG